LVLLFFGFEPIKLKTEQLTRAAKVTIFHRLLQSRYCKIFVAIIFFKYFNLKRLISTVFSIVKICHSTENAYLCGRNRASDWKLRIENFKYIK